jgi:rhodanese-related sulfurtransferase
MQRQERSRNASPRSVPWAVEGESDVVAVDTTWGELQPLHAAPGVRTVGELELVELVEQGAVVIDSPTAGSFGGRTIPGSVNIPHTEILERKDELDPGRVSILFSRCRPSRGTTDHHDAAIAQHVAAPIVGALTSGRERPGPRRTRRRTPAARRTRA